MLEPGGISPKGETVQVRVVPAFQGHGRLEEGTRVERIGPGDDPVGNGNILDRGADRTDGIHAGAQRGRAQLAQAAEGRLQADQPAQAGRDADGTAAIAAQ